MSIIYIILYINRSRSDVSIIYIILYINREVTIRHVYYLYYTLYKQGGHDQTCLLFILYFI